MGSKIAVFIILFAVSAFAANEAVKWYSENSGTVLSSAPATKVKFDTKAKNFQLVDTFGKIQDFQQWQGNVIVLNFWATWCPPCLRETPMFVELQEKYQNKGLQFVGVAIDSLEPVKDFMDTYGINYPILIGAEDAIEIAKSYGNSIGSLPYSVVIDRSGKIVFAKTGEFKAEKLEPLIKSLLPS